MSHTLFLIGFGFWEGFCIAQLLRCIGVYPWRPEFHRIAATPAREGKE